MESSFELIRLEVSARGEVLSSNLDEFRAKVSEALAGLNRNLQTDEDFGQAELDVKGLKNAEDVVKQAKEKALADAKSLHEFFAALDDASEDVRKARLELEKQIKERKEQIRSEIIAEAKGRLVCSERLRDQAAGTMFETEIKGKRSLDSMRQAMDKAVALINRRVTDNRKTIDLFIASHSRNFVMDSEELEIKSPDYVEGELRRRVEAHRAEIERKRLADEAAAAKAEADQVKRDLDEVNKPPLPTSPVPRQAAVTEEEEWQGFRDALFGAFASLKGVKANLKHVANIDRANRFAQEVNRAWSAVNGEGGAR